MGNIFDKPVIGVVMCRNRLKGHETQTLQEKYLNAVLNAGGLPIAIPHALAEPELLNALLPKLDGIFLPGSRTFMVKMAMSLTPIPGGIVRAWR